MARSKPVAAPTETCPVGQLSNLRLNALSAKLTSFQRELFDGFWKHYQANEKWPPTRVLHSKIGTQKVRDALRSIGGDVVRELENPPNDTYELSLIGILMTSKGESYRRLLLRYLEFLREQFISNPGKVDFTDKEIQHGLSLSDAEAALLGKLVPLGHSLGAASWGDKFWTIRVPKEVEYLPRSVPLDGPLDEWLFRHFQHRPVFAEEARRLWNQEARTYNVAAQLQPTPQAIGAPIDALKRRYQVFVSSTYEDLKEERQHVIQALLETKCIPLGMELFPAASIEQWQLIKRVIDECDYYIVVIAGRYGSLNEAQIGYTEMEFEYALSIEKPVIGFYHKNPETLPLSKSEKTDVGRDRLKKFTEKLKGRVCRPWISAAELGSAVKSAIIHELEFNPKPGWIRADAVTPSEQVEKLKQRIADLEERLKKKTRQEPAHSTVEPNLRLRFEVVVRPEKGKEDDLWDVEVSFTWDELFGACAEIFKTGAWSEGLRRTFPDHVHDKIESAVATRSTQAKLHAANIPREVFEYVLHTFVAQKLLKVSPHGWTEKDGAWLKVTDKGLQRLSETKVRQRHGTV